MGMKAATEQSRLWRAPHQRGVELFKADFRQFAFDRHSHPQLAVGLIEHGAEGLHYRGGRITVPAGSMVLIEPGETHTGFAAADSGYRYRMFYFEPELVAQVARGMGHRAGIHFPAPVVDDRACFAQLQALHRQQEPGAHHQPLAEQCNTVLALQSLLARHGKARERPQAAHRPGAQRVRDYLLAHLHGKPTLDALVEIAGQSRVALIDSFKAQYGLPPHAWLLRVRTEHAKQCLLDGQSPAEVAFQCGYADQAHLTRLLKRYHGITPAALRSA